MGNDEEFLLVVSGQALYAPYLAGWQEFKDHIRKIVKEQPGWTNVFPGKRSREMQGWCKLKDREDAEAVYNTFCRSKGILVHAFATSLRSGAFELLYCNCGLQFADIGNGGHSPRRSGIDVSSVNQAFGDRCAMTTPRHHAPVQPLQPTYQYANYYQAPQYTTSFAYPSSAYSHSVTPMHPTAPQLPAYSQSTGGLPVNLSNGAMITEARGIFIQGLNYSVQDNDLATLMRSAGLRPVEVRLRKDSKGSSKGVATAKFGSKEEAQRGVTALHGKPHMERTLTVRLDTEATVVGRTDPLVVVGTIQSASGY